MSSPLVFVRDGRTLPYIPVTIAALDAIRAACEQPRGAQARSYPHALGTYVALLELANRSRGDRVASGQTQIAERAGASRRAVQRALTDLVDAGVLEIHAQHHNEARIENEYVVVEPPRLSDAGVAPDRRSRARPSRPSDARDEDREEKQPRTRASARVGGGNGVAFAGIANSKQPLSQNGGHQPAGNTGRNELHGEAWSHLVAAIDAVPDDKQRDYPSFLAVASAITAAGVDDSTALAVAKTTRAIVASQGRVTNIAGLYAQQLRKATTGEVDARRAA